MMYTRPILAMISSQRSSDLAETGITICGRSRGSAWMTSSSYSSSSALVGASITTGKPSAAVVVTSPTFLSCAFSLAICWYWGASRAMAPRNAMSNNTFSDLRGGDLLIRTLI